jgi:chromosome segregation ATPase
MFRFWDRMEDFFLRNASEIVDDIADQRHEQLAELLSTLDARTAQVAAAEDRAEQLEKRLGALGPDSDRSDPDEIDRLLAELTRSDDQVADTQREVREQAQELVLLRERVATQEADRVELDRQVGELEPLRESEGERSRITSELDAFARELTEREEEVARREEDVLGRETTAQQIEDFKARREDVEALAALLERRESVLREREAEAASAETFAESARSRAESQERRLSQAEETVRDRLADLDTREADLDERSARFEADTLAREDRLEDEESRLRVLEERLTQKESELSAYVGQVQGMLRHREQGAPPTSLWADSGDSWA